MIKIRREQLEALSNSQKEAFVTRIVQRIYADYPNQCKLRDVKKEDLTLLVKRGIVNAEKYGLTCEDGIRQYIDCMFILGPHFDRDDRYPWAGNTLQRNDIGVERTIETIAWHMLSAVDWEKILDG